MRRAAVLPALALAGLAAFAAAPDVVVPPEADSAAATITDAPIRAHVQFLASDLLEGRSPSTRGDALARAYVASQFEALGLEPGAPEGGFVQPVPLVGIVAKIPAKTVFEGPRGKRIELASPADFVAFSGVQDAAAKIENAELVFVGYGIVAPEFRWDDYKDVDVSGKVLLMMNNDPENDPNLFAGKTRLHYGRWDYKYEIAAKKGAVGAILIHTRPSAGYPWQVVQSSWSGTQYELPYAGEPRVQIRGWTTEDASRKLAALGGKDLDALRASAESRDFRPVPLGVRLTMAISNEVRKVESGNVIARLAGSDPALAGEAVLYTAHHDHLGKREDAPPGADAIYNGAVDNASGVASLLAIARAYKALPRAPKRSVFFATVTAEEQGLLGSLYLAAHPPIPAGRIAADINIDSVNIFGRTRDLTYIGFGKSSVDALVVALAKRQDRTVKPDQFPDRGSFYRSDQYSLAKVGVPAAYFGRGTDYVGKPAGWGREQIEKWESTHYHQPSDEYSRDWDLSGAVDDVRLDFLLGVAVADAPELPAWNPGDEFAAARAKALEEAKKSR